MVPFYTCAERWSGWTPSELENMAYEDLKYHAEVARHMTKIENEAREKVQKGR